MVHRAPSPPPPRLHLLQAPRAHVGVLFRRGPSKRVEVVRWDMRRDAFERGHWFTGRIYERRSDLSPDGELLVYFASKFTAPRVLRLNHRPDEATPHPRHRPRGLTVEPDPDAHGENDPLYSARLTRDGWELRQEGALEWRGLRDGYVTHAPEVRARRHPERPFRVMMHRRLDGLRYRERFRVEGPSGEATLPAGRIDWVDWDSSGRLIALVDGRVEAATVGHRTIGAWQTLADLNADRPEARVPPPDATVW